LGFRGQVLGDLDKAVRLREGWRVRQLERSRSMGIDVVAQIRRATRKQFTAEEKIRIVLEGLRGETPISELCRRERIAPTMYYRWSKAFLDAGKNGLTRDTQRDATASEVRVLKEENATLKKALAESVLETMKYKKSLGM
jgi:transposase